MGFLNISDDDFGYYVLKDNPPKITEDVTGDGYIFEGDLHMNFYSYVVVHENTKARTEHNALDVAIRGIFSAKNLAEDAIEKMEEMDKENGQRHTFEYKIFKVPMDHINFWSEYDCKIFPHVIVDNDKQL